MITDIASIVLQPIRIFFRIFTWVYLIFLLLIRMPIQLLRGQTAEDVRTKFIESALIPLKRRLEFDIFSNVLITIATLFLITLSVLSISPLREVVIKRVLFSETYNYMKENREMLTSFFWSLSLVFDILIVIAIGGFIFTESLANTFKTQCEQQQERFESFFNTAAQEVETNIQQSYQNVIRSWDMYFNSLRSLKRYNGIRDFFRRYWEAASNTVKLYQSVRIFIDLALFNDIPTQYRNYLIALFYTNFPGGIHGILIFSLFTLRVLFEVFRIFLDSPLIIS